MRKIRNFLCFFICSFHLNCPTTEEQITDRQVLLGVTQKVSSNSKHTLLCLCGHYMSYDKHVKRMTSMYICLPYSLHGYIFITLQVHFYTTVNQCVNKSIRQ